MWIFQFDVVHDCGNSGPFSINVVSYKTLFEVLEIRKVDSSSWTPSSALLSVAYHQLGIKMDFWEFCFELVV